MNKSLNELIQLSLGIKRSKQYIYKYALPSHIIPVELQFSLNIFYDFIYKRK